MPYSLPPQGISPYQELRRQLDSGVSLSDLNSASSVMSAIIEETNEPLALHDNEHQVHLIDSIAYVRQMMSTSIEHQNPCREIMLEPQLTNFHQAELNNQKLFEFNPRYGAQITVSKSRFEMGARQSGKTMAALCCLQDYFKLNHNIYYEANPESNHHMGVCKFGGCIICENARPKPEKIITKFQVMGD